MAERKELCGEWTSGQTGTSLVTRHHKGKGQLSLLFGV